MNQVVDHSFFSFVADVVGDRGDDGKNSEIYLLYFDFMGYLKDICAYFQQFQYSPSIHSYLAYYPEITLQTIISSIFGSLYQSKCYFSFIKDTKSVVVAEIDHDE